MAIKRLHYFDQQFLVEKDFTDEQKYHVDMRRRLTKVLHGFGIADGLTVRRTGSREVTVDPGVAIDLHGRELVLEVGEPLNLGNLTAFPANTPVFITIAYDEEPTDSVTATGVTGDTRVTELPIVQATTTAPPTDGSVIRLALFTKTAGGDVPGNPNDLIDGGVRQSTSAETAAGSITDTHLAAAAVTEPKIAAGAVTEPKIAAGAVIEPKIATGAVTLAKLASNSVDATKIVDSSVTAAELANSAVITPKLADLAVTDPKIAPNAVTTVRILDGAVTGTKLGLGAAIANLADGAINAAKLGANAVTEVKILDGAVSEVKLATALANKINTSSGLVSIDGVSNAGGNIDLQVSGAVTVTPDNTAKRIVIGETHSGLTGNVHGLTAAQIGTIGALLSSQYDLRLRNVSAIQFTQNDVNGAPKSVPLTFTPRIVLAISACNALLGVGPRSYGGGSFGFFDAQIGTQMCYGPGITYNNNSDWFPRTDFPMKGICSAVFADNGAARAEFLSVSITATPTLLTGTLTRAPVGANQPLTNFQLTINLFFMGT